MAAAADVPGKYDVVINGQGYVFLDSIEPSLPFRTHRATYTRTPTFINRQNTQGNFGDDQQDWWLTATQNDWSEGEGQRFFRQSDDTSKSQYYLGSNVDVRIPGQVTMREAAKTITTAAAPQCAIGTTSFIYFATSTNLYQVNSAGTVTDLGAHGLGAAPFGPNAIASDVKNIYLTSTLAGSVGVRRFNIATPAFSTFSATMSNQLLFHNNTLYGMTGGTFRRYDTAGVATTIYTFQDALGNAANGSGGEKLLAFGGKVLIFRGVTGNNTVEGRAELYIYDGNGVSLVESFEPNFYATDATVAQGIIFVIGQIQDTSGGREAVFYVANGTAGLLWQEQSVTGASGIVPYGGGLVWVDSTGLQFVYYNLATGGPTRFAAATSTNYSLASNTYNFFSFINNSTSTALFPDTVRPTSSSVITSLFDFDSSLDKLVRGIKVDFTSATDGDGGSVDIAYRVGDVTGSYTNLQTGAVSGTEYALSGVSGRNLSVKITLKKGTSTNGPVLKRIYVRAAPILDKRKKREYVFDCTNTTKTPRKLRDGTYHPKSGREQVDDLNTAADLTTPFSITDRFGTFTGLIDLNDAQGFGAFEIHPSTDEPSKSGSFIVQVLAREV